MIMGYAEQEYLEGRVWAADPIGLVRMLYGGALDAVRQARTCLAAGDIESRGRAITKAMAIIGELAASLNHEVGGSVSQNLADLYAYMHQRLFTAHTRQEVAGLDEVESLLRTLSEAWAAVENPAPIVPLVGAWAAAGSEGISHSWSL